MPDDVNTFLALLRAIRTAVAVGLAEGRDPRVVRVEVCLALADDYIEESAYCRGLIERTIDDALSKELEHA